MNPDRADELSRYFLFATVVSCIAQLAWFAATSFTEIDYDGISYVGIARHLNAGQFHAAISAFRSPLISWLIAAGSLLDRNLLQVGKFINIASFLTSAALLYRLTKQLWHSRLAASVASLLFVLARGFAATAVSNIIPDFLLTALVLTYFSILLRCFRADCARDWLLLGMVHGIAYLAKAFALPWLALATLVSVSISFHRRPGHALNRLVLASVFPIVIAAAWATVLHSKYDVFTTGSQFRANFLHYSVKGYSRREPGFALLTNAVLGPGVADPSGEKTDEYHVNDPVPPHSPAWNYRFSLRETLPLVIAAEWRNLPGVIKELTILLTPGGILAFLIMLWTMMRHRDHLLPESNFTLVVAISALSLIFAYGMLVFISTYAFPLVPLMLAIGSRFLVSEAPFQANPVWRWLCIVLVLTGLAIAFTYPSSPFRTLDRNFQLSCSDAARKLEASPGSRLVTIGAGPYPEHGMGWEAGYRTAYFADWRVIAATGDLPDQLAPLISDLKQSSPDAVLLWGKPTEPRFQATRTNLALLYRLGLPILDPTLGQVGEVFTESLPSTH